MSKIIEKEHNKSNQVSIERDSYIIGQTHRRKYIRSDSIVKNSMEMSNNKQDNSSSKRLKETKIFFSAEKSNK
jgi:hypothetical protein